MKRSYIDKQLTARRVESELTIQIFIVGEISNKCYYYYNIITVLVLVL